MSYNVSDTLSKDKLSPEPRMIKTIGQVAVRKFDTGLLYDTETSVR